MRYEKYVSVISPDELRNEVRYTAERLAHAYSIRSKDRLQKALFDYKKKKHLNLTGVDLRDISVLSEVSDPLDIILKMNFINDFSFLKRFTKIKGLKITCQKVEDFSFLPELKELTSLGLKETGFSDLRLLSNCSSIVKIY